MKFIFLSILFLFVSCNGSGGGSGSGSTPNVTPGGISSEQVAREFIKSSQTSIQPEQKLQNSDLEELEKEGLLTSEEKKQLLENI